MYIDLSWSWYLKSEWNRIALFLSVCSYLKCWLRTLNSCRFDDIFFFIDKSFYSVKSFIDSFWDLENVDRYHKRKFQLSLNIISMKLEKSRSQEIQRYYFRACHQSKRLSKLAWIRVLSPRMFDKSSNFGLGKKHSQKTRRRKNLIRLFIFPFAEYYELSLRLVFLIVNLSQGKKSTFSHRTKTTSSIDRKTSKRFSYLDELFWN